MWRAGSSGANRAAAAGPQSKALIEMALEAERRGDLAGARRHLEEAARRDATFLPRWTLINFLMRHGQSHDVLSRAAPAAAIYEGDLSGLFDLCPKRQPDQITGPSSQRDRRRSASFLQLLIRRGKQLDSLRSRSGWPIWRSRTTGSAVRSCDQLLTAAVLKVAQLWKRLPRFWTHRGQVSRLEAASSGRTS
jgi:hypothetical protein